MVSAASPPPANTSIEAASTTMSSSIRPSVGSTRAVRTCRYASGMFPATASESRVTKATCPAKS